MRIRLDRAAGVLVREPEGRFWKAGRAHKVIALEIVTSAASPTTVIEAFTGCGQTVTWPKLDQPATGRQACPADGCRRCFR